MRARSFLLGTLVGAALVAVAGVTWAGDRTAAHYGPPRNGYYHGWHQNAQPGHWYGSPHHPYRQVYRPHPHWRPYPNSWRGPVYHQYYAPYYSPLYGSQFSATIVQPNWAFSWSVGLP